MRDEGVGSVGVEVQVEEMGDREIWGNVGGSCKIVSLACWSMTPHIPNVCVWDVE